MMPEASVLRLGNNVCELRIQGFFAYPHWMVSLLSGLMESQIAVVTGKAVQDRQQQWDARFRLDFQRSKSSPENVPYIVLTQRRAASNFSEPLRLTHFQIERRADQSMEVRLEGPDQLGFLGRLLCEMSLLALFPVEMDINTSGGNINDKIVFRGFGGLAPGPHIDAALENLLNGFTSHR